MIGSIDQLDWQHGDSRRSFPRDAWPITIGTGSDADIRLAGPGGLRLAQIDGLQGQVFLQPLLRPSPLHVDGVALRESVLLRPGQVITAYGLRLTVAQDNDTLRLIQDSRGGSFATAPPELPATDDDEAIRAADWQPATQAALSRRRRRWWPAVATLALLLMVLPVWWLTTSITLRLETQPAQPDQVTIDGPGISLRVAGRWLLRPGVHTITLQTDGYADLQRVIDLDGSQPVVLLEQQPLPGALLVDSNASAAGAVLHAPDGSEYVATLPARFEGLLPDEYSLTVTAPGYLDWSDTLEVIGLKRQQRLQVQLVPDIAEVAVTTTPAGATVVIDDSQTMLAETTPARIRLPSGRHRVTYRLDGYKPVTRTYEVYPNTTSAARPISFEPSDASLRVQSLPAGATVTLDGQFQGRAPIELALEPERRYQLRLTRPGYAPVTRSVALAAAERDSITIALDARLGEVTIRTVPVDADIYINGQLAGQGTLTTSLPAEPQQIGVRKAGYERFTATVTPRPGFSQTIDARLLTLEEARLKSIPQTLTVANGHTLRYVRGGTFRRGTSRREPDRRSNEPLRDERITRAFYVGIHEVSNRQFAAFRRNHDARGDVYVSLAGDQNPVVNVSWQDAAAYCNWLSEQEGLTPAYVGEFGKLVASEERTNGYRLPSEGEWIWIARYGAREGEALRFGWGDAMPPPEKTANLADINAKELVLNIIEGYRDGFPASAPVGSFAANAAGLFDLDGNVAEWVGDVYAVSPAIDGPLIDYRGARDGTDHVIRGPSWRSANVSQLRLAYRESGGAPRDDVGFRIVRDATSAN